MAKQSLVKQLLTKAGLMSRAEIARGHDFVHGAVNGNRGRIPPDDLYKLLKLLVNFLQLDQRNVCNIPGETIYGLGYVLAQKNSGQLKFVSFASPAYIQNSRGEHVDISSGFNKQEYRKLQKIGGRLEEMFNMPFNYSVYLVDLDPEVKGKSKDEIDSLFKRNLRGLRQVSDREAEMLSSLVNQRYLEEVKSQIAKDSALIKEIENLQARKTVRKAHKITPEAIEARALTYAALGCYLEDRQPNIIVLDIQGKIYPYEQPFYNSLRQVPLPLLRVIRP